MNYWFYLRRELQGLLYGIAGLLLGLAILGAVGWIGSLCIQYLGFYGGAGYMALLVLLVRARIQQVEARKDPDRPSSVWFRDRRSKSR